MPIYQEFKKGKVTYTVYVSKMIKGIQYRRKKRGVSSLVQAKKIENDLRIDLHNKIHGVKNYTWNEWYEVCMKRVSLQFLKSTMANYKGNMTKWVNGEIGHLNLKDITSEKIHTIILDKCGNISAEAKRSVLKQIKRFFAMAVDDGLITKNPSRPIKVKVPESTQAILNKSEIDKLLYEGKRQGHQFYNHWALALLTGMRNGELHALTWNDVDLENRVISVTKSWSRVDGIGPTKSTKNRYIPISNELFDFLVDFVSENKQFN